MKRAADILAAVAAEYDITVEDLVGWGRDKWVSRARAEAALRLYDQGRGQRRIGEALGGRDHSTVSYLIQRARERREQRWRKRRLRVVRKGVA